MPEHTPQALDVDAALDTLFAGLREAKRQFETGTDAGRAGAVHAVETCMKFLSVFQPVLDAGLNAPLLAINNALLALDDGKVLPIIAPETRRGRRPDSAMRNSLKGGVIFTVDRLQRTGLAPRDAMRRVVSVLRKEGFASAERMVDLITVRGWAQAMAREPDGEAAQTYNGLVAKIPLTDYRGRDVESVRRAYLAELADIIRSTRGAEEKPIAPPADNES
jgi:hypothetical protein